MPRLPRLLALVCALPVVAAAQISFVFNFNDTDGTGFNDAMLGATRRAALQSAATTLSSYFTGYTRTVTIDVTSFSNAGSGTLASAGSYFFNSDNTFQPGLVAALIQTDNSYSQPVQGTMNWNLGKSWDYDDDVAGGSFHFRTVAMHELLHAFGFASFIGASGTGQGTNGLTWSVFDQFLTDASGNRLVSAGGVYQGGSILTDGIGGDVFFSGPAAMATFGGRVPIYSPVAFLEGSSLSHLDTDFFTSQDYIMEHAIASGVMIAGLSSLELAILSDLGYSVIPEPSTYALLFGVGALAFAGWRRRRAA